MELGFVELGLILVTVVSVLGIALTLAWIDASPRRASQALDQLPD